MVKKKEPRKVRPPKLEVKSAKITGKTVMFSADSEPIGEVVRLKAAGKPPKTIYLTAKLDAPKPRTTIRVHRTEDQAVRRISRKFPVITPRLRKKL